MPRRIEQLNDQLRNELANLISREIKLKNGLITISYVICSPDLKFAKIGVSVLPEQSAVLSLNKLKKCSGLFCRILRKKLKIRQIPKFNWVIDETESRAAVIDEILKKINEK